jgi:hypothetical protein
LFWLSPASLSLIVGRIFPNISNRTLGTADEIQLLQNQNYVPAKFSSCHWIGVLAMKKDKVPPQPWKYPSPLSFYFSFAENKSDAF